MAVRVKVIDLAKELGVTSKDLIVALEGMGHKGVRAMSPLLAATANELRVKLGRGRELPAEAKPKRAPKPKPAEGDAVAALPKKKAAAGTSARTKKVAAKAGEEAPTHVELAPAPVLEVPKPAATIFRPAPAPLAPPAPPEITPAPPLVPAATVAPPPAPAAPSRPVVPPPPAPPVRPAAPVPPVEVRPAAPPIPRRAPSPPLAPPRPLIPPGAPPRPAAPPLPTRPAAPPVPARPAAVAPPAPPKLAPIAAPAAPPAPPEPPQEIKRELIKLPESVTVGELAAAMRHKATEVIKALVELGVMATVNEVLDPTAAKLVADRFHFDVEVRSLEGDVLEEEETDPAQLRPRPPVVTVMGHVDHGKTSLLDAIRSTEVAAGEAGGITQHIGAYQVTAPSGNKITFIDTPGHAAFTAMRARGAKVTDIVVLVVAADDGVMPQTVEAINHAKAAKVPMIVAINKIDRPDAKSERVRTELLQHEVQVETLGGQVLDVEVSATKKLNIERLLETIGLQSEILDLKANPSRPAEGTVIEAKLDRGRGPVATVLVQRGTLRVGDLVVAGADWGRVRALVSDTGTPVETAGPSTPVEVLGFNGTPEAGDRLAVVQTEARAREVTAYRARQRRDKIAARATGMRGSLEQMMSQLKAAGRKDLALIIKADVQGSLEAVIGAIEKLATDEVGARVIHSGVGGITESDVTLAEASGVPILGFNVRAHKEAREAAERAGIEIRYYNIIYDLVDDVKKAMSGLLAPTVRETMLGNATILEIFKVSKVGNVAGCRVTDGVVERGANVRLIRDSVVVHEGKLSQLKRFKDDAREVVAGQECGMAFESYQDMKVGDVIECYRVETVQRSL